MKPSKLHAVALLAASLIGLAPAPLPAQPLVNLGLVGVGRLSGDSFDQLGAGLDTLGGIFSGMWLDPATIVHSNGTIHATIFGLPDRGFGDALTDYHPRIQRLAVAITPYFGPGPVAQDQIKIVNTETYVFTVNGKTFTGYQPDDTNVLTHPQSLPDSVGGGKWSLDAEGIALAGDGNWYISDEYGPFVYKFDPVGALLSVLPLPDAYLPKLGPTYPRPINFLTASTIATNDSGRYINRGMEGLSVTPDGKRLVASLQSPLVQDGQNRNPSRNVRVLVYNIDPASPAYGQPIAEYVHVLPLSAAEANNRHTPVSEVHALSDTKFLILQRDSRGLGGDPGRLLYKRIVEVDASRASNILGTGYDLEKDAPGALSLPRAGLPTNIVAMTSRDLVDLLNPTQLAKYGLNLAESNQNINTLSEKWEAMAIVPLQDPAAPNDYLLLVGNDNDFRAPVVYHNGQPVGTNTVFSDNLLLAFRIGADAIAPIITCPAPGTVSAGSNCTATVDWRSRVTVVENSAAPVTVSQTPSATTALGLGTHTLTFVVTDAAGNRSESCTTTVTVVDTTGPTIVGLTPSTDELWPPNGKLVPVTLAVTATDNCSASVTCELISITSNEPTTGGSDTTSPDWEITGPLSANLRAERLDTGAGRIYTLTVRCTDEVGNASLKTTTVVVPKSQKRQSRAEL
jgi:hypothetical protein